MFIVQMHRENLSHAFAFCLHGSLKQCLLNFRREFTLEHLTTACPKARSTFLGNSLRQTLLSSRCLSDSFSSANAADRA